MCTIGSTNRSGTPDINENLLQWFSVLSKRGVKRKLVKLSLYAWSTKLSLRRIGNMIVIQNMLNNNKITVSKSIMPKL